MIKLEKGKIMFTFKYMDSMITLVIGFILITTLTILGCVFLRKKEEKTKMLPIKVVFWMLVIMEVMKIYYLIGENQGFYPNRYPIVFCSIVLYTYPMFCFKKNKLSDLAMGISTIPCLISILFVFLTVGDNPLMRENGTFSIIHFHSIVYHLLMYGVSIYLMGSGLYQFRFKKSIGVSLSMFAYIGMATVISLFIKGDISFFGPGFNGAELINSATLGIIYKQVGYVPGNLLLGIVMTLLSFAIYGSVDLGRHLKDKAKKKGEVENA